jgi:hypothetical protein
MPNWASVFRTTERDEALIEKRLDALASHIESLQSPH